MAIDIYFVTLSIWLFCQLTMFYIFLGDNEMEICDLYKDGTASSDKILNLR